MEKFPHLRSTITQKLVQTLPEIKSGKVFRGILWILGEYVESTADVLATVQELRGVLGEIPILASEQRLLDESVEKREEDKETADPAVTGGGGGRPKVLADGTYATETAYTSTTAARLEAVKAAAKPPLRSEYLMPVIFRLSLILFSRSSDIGRRLFHGCSARYGPDETGPAV